MPHLRPTMWRAGRWADITCPLERDTCKQPASMSRHVPVAGPTLGDPPRCELLVQLRGLHRDEHHTHTDDADDGQLAAHAQRHNISIAHLQSSMHRHAG